MTWNYMGPITRPSGQQTNELASKETRDYGIMALSPTPLYWKVFIWKN